MLSRFASDYGMLLVLLLLCALCSWVTWAEQHPTGAAAGEGLAADVVERFGSSARVIVVARASQEDAAFADALRAGLASSGVTVLATVKGDPADARRALQQGAQKGDRLDVIACNQATAEWAVFDDLEGEFPQLGQPVVVMPRSYWWPNFLKPDNLLNVAN